jgi:hypothetical protein
MRPKIDFLLGEDSTLGATVANANSVRDGGGNVTINRFFIGCRLDCRQCQLRPGRRWECDHKSIFDWVKTQLSVPLLPTPTPSGTEVGMQHILGAAVGYIPVSRSDS